MATLVFTAVGNLVGGPIGAGIGALIGQQFDARLFAPPGRKGPRLHELAVQTSSYGAVIPKLFGVNRVSGTVIWATDLRETKKKVSGGKGQPKATIYSYSASFAVALSGRRIARVGRIWADGNLLRGAAGDFKTQTGFRLYTGDERQDPDPLIASAEGVGETPAYRGLAYAVFEDFQLGEYGNRIPSLSFEIVADEDGAPLKRVVEELSEGTVAAAWPGALGGIAATGESLRGLIESFAPLLPVAATEADGFVSLAATPTVTTAIGAASLGASPTSERGRPVERERLASLHVPRAFAVAHYEPSRDYQQGLQRIPNPGGEARERRLDLPATASGSQVKGLAVAAALRSGCERHRATVRLPWRLLDLTVGDAVSLPGDPQAWRIEAITLEHMVLIVHLRAYRADDDSSPGADAGSGVLQPDLLHGATQIEVLDLPPLEDSLATAPRVAIAAAGASPGWRAAGLLTSFDGGVSWNEAGVTAAPATLGVALGALADGSPHERDDEHTVEVELLSPTIALADADDAAIDGGANLAMLGNELIQFATATPTGIRRYRLSRLLRGRRGSEWASASHAAGERFVLIEAEALAPLAVPSGAQALSVMAVGIGDSVPIQRDVVVSGEAVRPPSPVHLRAERQPGGDTILSWVRRSRSGWRWSDEIDAPLGEESERYRLSFAFDSGLSRTLEVSAAEWVYSAAERAADVAAGAASAAVSVTQIGTLATSRPAAIAFSLT